MKPVRRSQVIAPFGVGAMVDFPGPVTLVHAGLDSWPIDATNPDHSEFIIDDELRLASRLGVKRFILPPDYRMARRDLPSDDPNLNIKLPFLRFPLWHFCPTCGLMKKAEYRDKTAPVCDGTAKQKHPNRKMVQVRFIAVCDKGHMQDFPWFEWVLKDDSPDIEKYHLRMRSGGSASLAGIKIICEHKGTGVIEEIRSLAGAFDKNAFDNISLTCKGHNPALAIPSPNYKAPRCGEPLLAKLKGGSDVYYSNQTSSIYIPQHVPGAKEEALEILEDARVKADLGMWAGGGLTEDLINKLILSRYYPHAVVSAKELFEAYEKGRGTSEEVSVTSDDEEQAYRRHEYNVLSKDIQEGTPKLDLLIESEDINSYQKIVTDYIERISLVHKLRETRAFTGFSRVYDNLSMDEKWSLLSHKKLDWLPGIIVRGEGIFMKFREDKIRTWINEHEEDLSKRLLKMQESFDSLADYKHIAPRFITPRLVLLHTISHLFINQLIYECGYGSASLRERLYVSDDLDNPMSGILIYTSAGDSEGTMGGLVRMGYPSRMEDVIKHALEEAQWCSSDPVCIESNGQGPDNSNLAACHACALLPETSCEEGNRLLDRGIIVGTLKNKKLAFFSDHLEGF